MRVSLAHDEDAARRRRHALGETAEPGTGTRVCSAASVVADGDHHIRRASDRCGHHRHLDLGRLGVVERIRHSLSDHEIRSGLHRRRQALPWHVDVDDVCQGCEQQMQCRTETLSGKHPRKFSAAQLTNILDEGSERFDRLIEEQPRPGIGDVPAWLGWLLIAAEPVRMVGLLADIPVGPPLASLMMAISFGGVILAVRRVARTPEVVAATSH